MQLPHAQLKIYIDNCAIEINQIIIVVIIIIIIIIIDEAKFRPK